MYRQTATTARALFDSDGTLLALVADGDSPLAFLSAEGATEASIAEHIAGLDREGLAAVVAAAVEEGRTIGASDEPITDDVLARIEALAGARAQAEARDTELVAAETERATRAADALARLAPTEPAADAETPPAADGETPPAEVPAEEPQAVAASAATRPVLPRPGQTRSTAPAGAVPAGYAPPRATSTLVASADLGGIGLSAGDEITTRTQLGKAIDRRRGALRTTRGGDGEQVIVASIVTEYPEGLRLGDDAAANHTRIADATTREALVAAGTYAQGQGALVAAGGLCAPLEQLYDVPVVGSQARPVRDALANFSADRGGVKWRDHLSFADFAGATGVWTMEDDESVGTQGFSKVKPCMEVECGGENEAIVEALTFCMEFSNVTARFDPESTAANVEAGLIAHARFAENRLLAQMAALSTTVTDTKHLSAVRDLLVGLDKLIAAYRNIYRLDDDQALRAIMPRWARDLIRADLTRGMAGELEALAVADATVNSWFAARGVNITWHLDGRGATTQAGTAPALTEVGMVQQYYNALVDNAAVPTFPTQVETLLFVEGEMLHLDGGSLDLGVVRDSSLNQVNRYKQFSETFEGIAHRGVEAVRMVSGVSPTGMVAGTADTTAILGA